MPLVDNNSVSKDDEWITVLQKIGRHRIHGMYDFVDQYRNNSFFNSYHFEFKQSAMQLNSIEEPRKYLLFHLPVQNVFPIPFEDYNLVEHHLSIDSIFVNKSVYYVPCHYKMTLKNPLNKTILVYGIVSPSHNNTCEWNIAQINAYHMQPKEPIALTPEQEQIIFKEAQGNALTLLKEIQIFKDQCCYNLSLEMTKIEQQLLEQESIFFSESITTQDKIRIRLNLMQEQKEILSKLYLFSYRAMRKTEDPQVLFLDGIIRILNDSLQNENVEFKEEKSDKNISKNNLTIFSSNSLSKKSQKTETLEQTKDIRNSCHQLMEEIKSEKDFKLLNRNFLILQETYEQWKKNNKHDKSLKKLVDICEISLAEKETYFELIKQLKKTFHTLSSLVIATQESTASILKDTCTLFKNASSFDVDNVCLKLEKLIQEQVDRIHFTWQIDQQLTRLQLIHRSLSNEDLDEKRKIIEKYTRELNVYRYPFLIYFHMALNMPGGDRMIKELYTKFPVICDTPKNWNNLQKKIEILSRENVNNMHPQKIKERENYINLGNYLYEDSPNYRVVALQRKMSWSKFLLEIIKNNMSPRFFIFCCFIIQQLLTMPLIQQFNSTIPKAHSSLWKKPLNLEKLPLITIDEEENENNKKTTDFPQREKK